LYKSVSTILGETACAVSGEDEPMEGPAADREEPSFSGETGHELSKQGTGKGFGWP